MKMKECIFNTFSNTVRGAVAVCALVAMMGGVAHAAIDNTGCDNDNNAFINPEFALCTTHVYNIGDKQNPDNDALKQLTSDVVALKSTLITQQIYAQYEFLEATLRRLKTQLEKEVLLAGLEAAGAEPSSSSGASGSKSTDKNIKLNGASNCQVESGTTAVLQCIQKNIRIVTDAVNAGGNNNEAKKQLETDLEIAKTWGGVAGTKNAYKQFADGKTDGGSPMTKCNEMSKCGSKADCITNCAYELNASVSMKLESLQSAQRNQNTWGVRP